MTENQKKLHSIIDKMEKPMLNLYFRWADEKEYEDFSDYQAHAKTHLEKLGATFVKMKKRPFAAFFTLPGVKGKLFSLVVTSREYKCMVQNI